MQIGKALISRIGATATGVGRDAMALGMGGCMLGGLYLSDWNARLSGEKTPFPESPRPPRHPVITRFAGRAVDALTSHSPHTSIVTPVATQQPQPKDSDFYNAQLNLKYPLVGDPRYDFKSDAGLIVSYRGRPEIWTGPTADVVSAIPRRDANNNLVPHVIGQVAQMGEAEAKQALETAKASWKKGEWKNKTLTERSESLEQALNEVQTHRDEIVSLLMHEIGKSKVDAESEFDRTLVYMRDVLVTARSMDQESETVHYSKEHKKYYSQYLTAKGIALVMGPSNYPWNEGFGTTAFPALVAGNSLIYKAPRSGQLCLQTVLECFAAHLPEGVLNVISGDGRTIIPPIMESGDVDLLYFVGSAKVGKSILKMHPDPGKLKPYLGLGSKNPMIVLEGADLRKTAAMIEKAAFGNRGERCTGVSFVFAPRDEAEALAEVVADLVEQRKAGMPWDQGVSDTPFADSSKWQWMENLLTNALARGAKIINPLGGQHNGHHYIPAVLYPVTLNMKIASEEVFGPLVAIIPYDNESEILIHLASLSQDHDLDQQAAVIPADGQKVPDGLRKSLRQLYAALQKNAIPKRYDGTPGLPFSARHENPLGGARVALVGASVMVYEYE